MLSSMDLVYDGMLQMNFTSFLADFAVYVSLLANESNPLDYGKPSH